MTTVEVSGVALTIEQMSPRPGDLIVLTAHAPLEAEEFGRIAEALRERVPAGVHVLILDQATLTHIDMQRGEEGRQRFGTLTTAAILHAQSEASRFWQAPPGQVDATQAVALERALDGVARTAAREAVIAYQREASR